MRQGRVYIDKIYFFLFALRTLLDSSLLIVSKTSGVAIKSEE